MLAFRAMLFAILGPGTAVGLIPWLLLRGRPAPRLLSLDPPRSLGFVLLAAGGAALLWCIRDFAVTGRGTLAVVDPPRRLVRVGLYRHVRNPMYVAVVTTLFGEALFFESRTLAFYAAVVWLMFHLFVVLYEEPHLRGLFGSDYEEYRAAVPRWIPRLRTDGRP